MFYYGMNLRTNIKPCLVIRFIKAVISALDPEANGNQEKIKSLKQVMKNYKNY